MHDVTSDEIGIGSGIEQHAARHVFGIADPPHDHAGPGPLDRLCEIRRGPEALGLDAARRDDVDGDAVRPQFHRQRLGQADHAGVAATANLNAKNDLSKIMFF